MNIQTLQETLKKLNLPFAVQKKIDSIIPTIETNPSALDDIIALIEAEAAVQDELAQLDVEEQTIYEDLLTDLQTLSIQMQAEQDEILAEELEKVVIQIQNLPQSQSQATSSQITSAANG